MVTPCHMQSGVAVHALGPEHSLPDASLENHEIRFEIFMFLGLALRVPPAVTRLTVYCWLHIPAQRVRDPGKLEHLWNKWMVPVVFLGLYLTQ